MYMIEYKNLNRNRILKA